MNKITEKDFVFDGKTLTESGFWGTDILGTGNEWTGNLSGMLTKLIQVAGSTCKHYASDLFISWSTFEKKRKSYDFDGGRFLFGFREMGVDHNPFILSHPESCYKYLYPGGIYMLEVKMEKYPGERGAVHYQFGKAKLKM